MVFLMISTILLSLLAKAIRNHPTLRITLTHNLPFPLATAILNQPLLQASAIPSPVTVILNLLFHPATSHTSRIKDQVTISHKSIPATISNRATASRIQSLLPQKI